MGILKKAWNEKAEIAKLTGKLSIELGKDIIQNMNQLGLDIKEDFDDYIFALKIIFGYEKNKTLPNITEKQKSIIEKVLSNIQSNIQKIMGSFNSRWKR